MSQVRIAFHAGELGEKQARAVAAEVSRFVREAEMVLIPVERADPAVPSSVVMPPIQAAVLEGRADMAVLSLHDLGIVFAEGLKLAAVTQRVDARDAAVTATQMPLRAMPEATQVVVDSRRREAQVPLVRADLQPVMLALPPEALLDSVAQGNDQSGILALADLKWMGREESAAEILAIEDMLPAPGQGALAILTREGDQSFEKAALAVHHRPTWACVRAERGLVSALGAGGDLPISALAQIAQDGAMVLHAAVFPPGGDPIRVDGTGKAEQPAELVQKVAEALKSAGADAALAGARLRAT